jgi:hypothetical protein
MNAARRHGLAPAVAAAILGLCLAGCGSHHHDPTLNLNGTGMSQNNPAPAGGVDTGNHGGAATTGPLTTNSVAGTTTTGTTTGSTPTGTTTGSTTTGTTGGSTTTGSTGGSTTTQTTPGSGSGFVPNGPVNGPGSVMGTTPRR